MKAGLLVIALAGCASFEDPTIVIDLRVIAMEAEPPEQVIDVDPDRPPTPAELLAQLRRFTVRAMLAEPGRDGELDWRMVACMLDDGGRCTPGGMQIELGADILLDPESALYGSSCEVEFPLGGTLCASYQPDDQFVALLYQAFQDDPVGGLDGIDVGVVLYVTGIGRPPYAETYAAKRVRFSPRIPAARRANRNPHMDQLLIGSGVGIEASNPHCPLELPRNEVRSGQTVTIFPVARDGDREDYVVPTLDGGSAMFTEYLSYQWIATAGSFSDEETGGPPDTFGNVRLDGTEWTAPEVSQAVEVTLWVIQRDARYGDHVRETCILVRP